MNNVVLVGTVHSDFKGPDRLMKILGFYKNPVIAIESTVQHAEDARKKIDTHRKSIEDTIAKSKVLFTAKQIASLRAYVNSYAYEINTPYAFQKQNPETLVFPVDLTVENLDKWMDFKVNQYIASGKDVSKLNGQNDPRIIDLLANGIEIHQKAIDQTYTQDDSDFMKELMGEIFPYLADKRDEIIAKRIRELIEEHPDRAIVGIFGNMHIFGKYERNLYEQLSDMKPVRIRLNEADNF